MAFSQRVLRLCFRRYTPRFFYEFPRPLATASSHSHSHSHRRSHSHGHGHGLFSLSVASSASAAFLFSQSLLSAEPHKYNKYKRTKYISAYVPTYNLASKYAVLSCSRLRFRFYFRFCFRFSLNKSSSLLDGNGI